MQGIGGAGTATGTQREWRRAQRVGECERKEIFEFKQEKRLKLKNHSSRWKAKEEKEEKKQQQKPLGNTYCISNCILFSCGAKLCEHYNNFIFLIISQKQKKADLTLSF